MEFSNENGSEEKMNFDDMADDLARYRDALLHRRFTREEAIAIVLGYQHAMFFAPTPEVTAEKDDE